MRQYHIEQLLKEVLSTWVILIQLDTNNTTPNEVLLVDSIYKLFTAICGILQLDGQYILDTWEKHSYSIDDTVKYIIENNFTVVEEEEEQ